MMRKSAFGVTALLLTLAWLHAPAAAQTVLKFASFVPTQYILHKPVFLKLADDLAAATGGAVTMKVYAAGALGKGPVEQYQRAVRRIAEISYGLPGYTSSAFPKTLLIELPGVTAGPEDATRKLWKVMDAHLRDEFKRTVPLALFVTPPAVFMMRDKPVRSLADLKGMKLRVASRSAASVVAAYGATPVPMPATKVYTSMSTGVVDGALMGVDSLLIFKLIETSKYVTIGLPEMPTTIFMVMNEGAYDELAAGHRAALDKLTGLGISLRSAALLAKFGDIALSKFRAAPGKTVIELTPDARKAFDARAAAAAAGVLEELDGKGLPASRVVEAMKN
ncbi:MAG: TRAP transporter substrate-binding protein [Defluviicoccus sp.]|nr:TRAP transporter substrate-binding protein [Defluviicoccus sp.]MDE0386181.1 TRAP transporter substrate-binding protein [Defluviicoccus sp.]